MLHEVRAYVFCFAVLILYRLYGCSQTGHGHNLNFLSFKIDDLMKAVDAIYECPHFLSHLWSRWVFVGRFVLGMRSPPGLGGCP